MSHIQRYVAPFLLFAGLTLFSSAAVAQTTDYFPLQVGNSWLYRLKNSASTEGNVRTISVTGKETIGGREYFTLDYFGRTLPVRTATDGSLVTFDRTTNAEKAWLALGLPVGSTFPTDLDECTTAARIESRTESTTTPAGQFTNALRLGFNLHCADAGTIRQIYAPAIGPVLHEETSFVGPRQYELAYYRVGNNNATAQEVSFTLALDAARYPADGKAHARLTLRSTDPNPIHLIFPSGQSFDVKLINEKGEGAYTWSANRIFPMIYREFDFGPGEMTFGVTIPLENIPAGRYKAQAYLTTSPIQYLGETSLEILP